MRMKKTQAGVAALAMAAAVAIVPQVQAASLPNPGVARVDSLVQMAKVKRRHAARHMGTKRPGSCGENMYWSRKARHCLDARDKA